MTINIQCAQCAHRVHRVHMECTVCTVCTLSKECTNGTLLLTMFEFLSFFCTLVHLVLSVMFFVHTHTKYDRHIMIQNPPQLGLEDSTEWQTGNLYSIWEFAPADILGYERI